MMAQDKDNLSTPTATVNQSYYDHDAVEKNVAVGGKFDDVNGLGPRRKRFLCWSLTKKQWIGALVGTIVGVLAVVLLILFLAVVPAIFQGQVDKVELTVGHLDLIKLSSDPNAKTISVDMSVDVAADSMAAATMYETTATLAYKGKAFGTVTLPQTELAKGKHTITLSIKGTSEIVDVEAFKAVSMAVVTDEILQIEVSADVKISAMGLTKGGLTLKRTLPVKGLNQFSQPAALIKHISIPECNPTNYKMLTNITLENDSEIGMDGIGVLDLSVYYEQEFIGRAVSVDGLGIPRGTVKKVFELTVEKTTERLAVMGKLLHSLLDHHTQLFITGNNAGAVKEAVLLSDALTKLNMSVLYTEGINNEYLTLNYDTSCAGLISLLA